LTKRHISEFYINWNRKSDNIKKISQKLNLGLDTFVFIDDNPTECAEVYLPGENSLLHEISIIFDKPVYVGDTLTVYGRVNKVLSLFKRVSINATIKNQNDMVVSHAIITVGLTK
ncbi:MAG: hypothetical protein II796_00530, partial [Oscillospiraceae bacterium]|nr:hypothetical protein [Oscillospiraceae bacterium]